jgi:hypothetical protein
LLGLLKIITAMMKTMK